MIITRVIDFPNNDAKAMCILDENNDYNIYLNARLSMEEQDEALKHELLHISRDDYACASVNDAERRTA